MNIAVDTKKITPILEKNDVEFAGVFGSYARGEETGNSDVDILIRFGRSKTLLDLAGLESELSDTLEKKVDLVTEGGLCKHIKDSVMKDLKMIYGRR